MRVVVVGRGGAGKSTFARSLAAATGVDCVELDTVFWTSDLSPTPLERWTELQRTLVAGESWILDGDLGPYDVVDIRLRRADTVVLFDPPTGLCVWRALRRSRERLEFWRWLLTWRRRSRPELMRKIAAQSNVELLVVRTRHDIERVMDILVRRSGSA